MSKTHIHLITSPIYAGEYKITSETELSYIAVSTFPGRIWNESIFAKNEEGKEWFWTKEEAKKHLEKQKEIRDQIKALESQLN